MKNFCLDLNTTTDKILGLDISTSCTGYSVVETIQGRCVELGYFQLDKCDGFFEKCNLFRKGLRDLKDRHPQIKIACIEENLQAFRPGLSSAKTINTLARFNGAASLITYEELCLEPVFLNAVSARSSLGIKIDKKSSLPTKQQIFDFVRPVLDIDWPVTKTGNYKTSCFDMSDAYVLARAGWLKR